MASAASGFTKAQEGTARLGVKEGTWLYSLLRNFPPSEVEYCSDGGDFEVDASHEIQGEVHAVVWQLEEQDITFRRIQKKIIVVVRALSCHGDNVVPRHSGGSAAGGRGRSSAQDGRLEVRLPYRFIPDAWREKIDGQGNEEGATVDNMDPSCPFLVLDKYDWDKIDEWVDL
uniref:Uncharacterized protein n=1 Tax=Oryza brachyantha TaxID=4533 RepID=J3N0H0_ORYBR